VGVAVPAGVENEFFAFSLIALPKFAPDRSPSHVGAEVLGSVVETLKADPEVSEVTIWTAAVTVIAEENGWTLDEASENLANLLNSLGDNFTPDEE
jgi:hypothetical protein